MNDLPTLDAELYRSLMLLRDYKGNAEDLSLSFAITDADLGENLEVRIVQHAFICHCAMMLHRVSDISTYAILLCVVKIIEPYLK